MANEWKNAGVTNVWDYKTEGKGAELIGIFTDKEEHVGENDSNVYTFKVDGELVSVWGSSVLDIRFKNLELGEEVKITYLGAEPSEKRKGKSYHNFEVLHRKPEVKDTEINVEDIHLEDLDSVSK